MRGPAGVGPAAGAVPEAFSRAGSSRRHGHGVLMSMAATPRVRVSVTTPSDAVTLCAVAGEVDHFSADEFRAQLLTALRPGVPGLVIDLSRVAFFGVAGLHALFEARALAEDADIRVRVVTGPPCVTRLLDISRRLAHAPEPGFEVVHSLADALLETR